MMRRTPSSCRTDHYVEIQTAEKWNMRSHKPRDIPFLGDGIFTIEPPSFNHGFA